MNIIQNKFEEYAKSEGFLVDMKIYKIPKEVLSKEWIPKTGYNNELFTNLTKDQKVECVNAFISPINLKLINKYRYTRMISYVLSLVQNFDDQFLTQKIVKECKILAETLNNNSACDGIVLIIKFYNYLNPLIQKYGKKN